MSQSCKRNPGRCLRKSQTLTASHPRKRCTPVQSRARALSHTLSSGSGCCPSPPDSLTAFGCCYPGAASQLRAQEPGPWDNTRDTGLLLPPWGAGAAAGLAGGITARGTIYHRARLARPVPGREPGTALPTARRSHGHNGAGFASPLSPQSSWLVHPAKVTCVWGHFRLFALEMTHFH